MQIAHTLTVGHRCSSPLLPYRPTAAPSPTRGTVSALSIFMDVRRTDRKASLASVAGELEMEEQGDGAKLLKSKASAGWQSFACVCCRRHAEVLIHLTIFLRRRVVLLQNSVATRYVAPSCTYSGNCAESRRGQMHSFMDIINHLSAVHGSLDVVCISPRIEIDLHSAAHNNHLG